MDSANVRPHDSRERQGSLTNWDDEPTPLADGRPSTMAADAARPQPFLHVVAKALTLAQQAQDAAVAGRVNGIELERFTAFMDGLTEERFGQVRTFLAWAAEAAGGEPRRDLAGFVRQFEKRLARTPVLREMWDGALCRPRDFVKDAHRAIYWASTLDIDVERTFPALEMSREPAD